MKRLLIAVFLFSPLYAAAQGVLYSSVAQAIATIPGSAQGVTNVFVPIPNAVVKICTGAYTGSACLTQTASIYQDQAMTIPITPYDVADAYGNFSFWAVTGTYYGTMVGTVAGAQVQSNFQFQLSAIGGPTVNSINGVSGAFTFSGSGVTCTSTTCTFNTAPAAYYQTMQSFGTAMTQRANLNFSQRFSLSDAAGNNQTNVDANATGSGIYLATALTLPASSTALTKFDGNGNIQPLSTPTQCAAPGAMTGIASNGNANCSSSTIQDEWFSFTGCAAPTDGNSACTLTGNTLPTAMADTNYFLNCTGSLSASDLSPSGAAGIGIGVSTAITSASQFNISVGYIGGSSTYFPYTATVTCHAHHN